MDTQKNTTSKKQNPAAIAPIKHVDAPAPVPTPTIAAPTAPVTAPQPKPVKSLTTTLRAGEQELICVAVRTKDGWRTEATHYETKAVKGERRSGRRGATVNHPDFTTARKALEAMVAQAIKAGWTKPEVKPLGIERKEDAFTLANLPKPAKK